MLKIFSAVALVLMFVLMVPAGLIMISQDAAKGAWNYPIKRGIEDLILAGVSLNPYTKAYFAVALANRRYDETEKLLASGENAETSLQELVTQTSTAAEDIGKVSSSQQRAKLIADLSGAIEKYDKGLESAQVSIDTKSQINSQKTNPHSATASSPPSSGSTSKPVPASSYKVAPSVGTAQNPQQLYDPVLQETLREQRESIERTRRDLEELRRQLEIEQNNLQQSPLPLPNQGNVYAPSLPPIQPPSPTASPSPYSGGFGIASDGGPVLSPSPGPSVTPFATPTLQPSPSVKGKQRNKEMYETSQGD